MALEREVEQEYRPRMLEALEQRVNALARISQQCCISKAPNMVIVK